MDSEWGENGVPLLACPAVHVQETLLDKPAVAPAAEIA